MAQNAAQESELIKYYLSKFKRDHKLEKSKEIAIGRRIKLIEQEILSKSIKYECFRNQITYLRNAINRNPGIIYKYSKDINQDSSKKEVDKYAKMFYQLFDALESDQIKAYSIIKNINFTSSTIYHLINNIKQIHKNIVENEEITKNLFKFFEISTYEEYSKLALECTDSAKLGLLARSLYSTNTVVIKKLNELERIFKFLKSSKLDLDRVKDVKDFVTEISALEQSFLVDRELLVTANLPLVVSRAKRYINSGIDLEDLIQEGNIGLMRAIDKFDPDRDVRVATYATWWIDQAIRRAISNKSKLVRIPVHVQRQMQKIHQAYMVLSQRLQRKPTELDIEKETGISVEEQVKLGNSALHEICIDSEVANGQSYCDILYDTENSPVKLVSDSVLKQAVHAAISELSPREQIAIKLRFGLGVEKEHTFEEVGIALKVTKARAMQLNKNSVKKLFTNKDLLLYNKKDNE